MLRMTASFCDRDIWGETLDGGGYRNRTDMRLLSEVFETSASASSANPPMSLLDHIKRQPADYCPILCRFAKWLMSMAILETITSAASELTPGMVGDPSAQRRFQFRLGGAGSRMWHPAIVGIPVACQCEQYLTVSCRIFFIRSVRHRTDAGVLRGYDEI